jgi:hypothetical protein
MYRSPIPEPLWERIRDEFNLPALEQVRERLSAVREDPEPVMRQLVRVFLSGLRRLDLRNSTSLGRTQKIRALRRRPPTVFV